MANTKVSELAEQKDLTGVQAVGEKGGMAVRYDIGGVGSKVRTALNGLVNPTAQTAFSPTLNYYVGQFCTYGGQLYRFVRTHLAGPWNGSGANPDAVPTDFWKELESFSSSDYETLTCSVGFFEPGGAPAAAEKGGMPIEVYFDDGSSNVNYTNSDGVATFTIKKGTHYVLSAPASSGFSKPVDTEYTAALSLSSDGTVNYGGRNVSLNYYRGASSTTATVTAYLRIDDSTYTNMLSAFGGKEASLMYPHGFYETRSKLSPQNVTMNWNGTTRETTAVFSNVKLGEYCTIYVPNLTGYSLESGFEQDGDHGFFVSGENVKTEIAIKYGSEYGIYYVCGCVYDESGTQITPASAAWHEFRIEDYPGKREGEAHCLSSVYPCVAVHVNTSDLAAIGCDYYVKPRDLTTQRVVSSCAWSTVNQLHPHVTTSYDPKVPEAGNGRLQTAYMMYDSNRLYGASSPAAEWAILQTLTIGSKTSHGFVGTWVQWQPLLDAYQKLDADLKWLGYSGQSYRSSTYFWSATQFSATRAWGWHSSSTWYNFGKTLAYVVLPFFAIDKL